MPCNAKTTDHRRGSRAPAAGSLPRPRARIGLALIACGVTVAFAGCASPPAVAPLMRVVDAAIADAHDQLAVDRDRAGDWVDQQRAGLTDAFEADLAARTDLSADWVRDHAMVYAVAREAMARHEAKLDHEYQTRRANLRDARRAQRAAIRLIEQHDALFEAVPDARRWLRDLATDDDKEGSER